MKSDTKYLSNLYDDGSLQGRKGRKIIKTPEKTFWKNMMPIGSPSKQRSISPTFSKKIKDLVSQFDLHHSVSPNNISRSKPILNRNPTESQFTQQFSRRAFRPILVNGEVRDNNKTSTDNILKSGWEIKYVNRKLPNPKQHQ